MHDTLKLAYVIRNEVNLRDKVATVEEWLIKQNTVQTAF